MPLEALAEPALGPGPLLAILAFATLLSEDLACAAAGLLVAQGAIGFGAGSAACLAGIAGGDLLLFLVGRHAPRSSLFTPTALARGRAWFRRHGAKAVFLARFVPGTRLPTYVAAGMLGCPPRAFLFWLLLAAAVWTPLLVGLVAMAGTPALAWIERTSRLALAVTAALAALLLVLARWRPGRCSVTRVGLRRRWRLLLSRWRRIRHWEFWPAWLVNLPVLLRVVGLGVQHRSLTIFSAANPAIPAGGFVLESKGRILRDLAAGSPDLVARFAVVPGGLPLERRQERVGGFMAAHGLAFPIVIKPDVGERGNRVTVARGKEQLVQALAAVPDDAIAQEFVPGPELGIFYYRHPGEERGRIFSVTTKALPEVTGDGVRTLEELILTDERAVCMARLFLERHRDRLATVPAAGDRVLLGELGNHCRGAVFRDGSELLTPALAEAIDGAARRYPGFFFGRFDLRGASLEAIRAGDFKVLELNGVTSEATHIYEPGASLGAAWRTLFQQWELAFAIGAANVRRGARPASLRELAALLHGWRRRQRPVPCLPRPEPGGHRGVEGGGQRLTVAGLDGGPAEHDGRLDHRDREQAQEVG